MYFSPVCHNSSHLRRSCRIAELSQVCALSCVGKGKGTVRSLRFAEFHSFFSEMRQCRMQSSTWRHLANCSSSNLPRGRYINYSVFFRIHKEAAVTEMHSSHALPYAFRLTLDQVKRINIKSRIKSRESQSHGNRL